MIAILDYGMGNIKSIHNMFKKIGIESIITSDIHSIKNAKKFLLPGVGAFDHGIKSLKSAPFFDTFEKEVLDGNKQVLGICLGMQLLGKGSEEGNLEGLGWIDAQSIKFNLSDTTLAIPHMGWNRVKPLRDNALFEHLNERSRFYFVHSYHVTCNDANNILATTHYGTDFTCSINKGNIYGVQFHPEKSHKYGMQLLKNFGNLPC
jgi:imidazole glycerol-phosphate synthase subunit HisH